MSGNGIDSDILKGVAAIGGVFAAAWLSDRIGFGGSKALFVGAWLVCGFIIYAVAVALLSYSSNTSAKKIVDNITSERSQLPMEVMCPSCKASLTLTMEERKSVEFTCSKCGEKFTVED